MIKGEIWWKKFKFREFSQNFENKVKITKFGEKSHKFENKVKIFENKVNMIKDEILWKT